MFDFKCCFFVLAGFGCHSEFRALGSCIGTLVKIFGPDLSSKPSILPSPALDVLAAVFVFYPSIVYNIAILDQRTQKIGKVL